MIRTATNNEVKIVIGSWGSYNAGNSRAMGSKLITLSDYDDWEDIEEELTKQGFQLDGITFVFSTLIYHSVYRKIQKDMKPGEDAGKALD